jgi:ATP-dependent Lon protease
MSEEMLYPYIPTRDVVLFPYSLMQISVAREKSIETLKKLAPSTSLLVLTQKNPEEDHPRFEDLYGIGTLARVRQITELPNGTINITLAGQKRIQTVRPFVAEEEGPLQCYGIECTTHIANHAELAASSRLLEKTTREYQSIRKKQRPSQFFSSIFQLGEERFEEIVYLIATNAEMNTSKKLEFIQMDELLERTNFLLGHLRSEIEILKTEKKIVNRMKIVAEDQNKKYWEEVQRKAIDEEFGGNLEFKKMEATIRAAKFPKEVREKVESEFKRLVSMSPMSAEYSSIKSYIELVCNLPWVIKEDLPEKKERNLPEIREKLLQAKKILDEDHYGLEKAKESIMLYLSRLFWTGNSQGKVLCLIGPPGVGKTSLVRSIAKATGRKCERISLGGVRDEAEVRGHRRTYVGSKEGSFINAMKVAGVTNPVINLDEIDKIGSGSGHGDPAAALLEVLDPEQNEKFLDHYLELPYDLSNVLFVATANNLEGILKPLRDRLGIIELSSYTEEEKVKITIRHIIPKLLENYQLEKNQFSLSEGAIRDILKYYVHEAGVRGLTRFIQRLGEKAIYEIQSECASAVAITKSNLQKYAGPPRFRLEEASREDTIGLATGLAWSEVGGSILFLEGVCIPKGTGKIVTTGNLGKVMDESIQAAFAYLRSQGEHYKIDFERLAIHDIHIHAPEGAIPKDGPSAGMAMFIVLFSLLTQTYIRGAVAMTGEIGLRGNVMPIGGLKEKILAAIRSGIKTVLIPEGNVKDLEEIPEKVLSSISIIPVKHVNEALEHAIVGWKKE